MARPRLATLGLASVVLAYWIAGPPPGDLARLGHLVAGSLLALASGSILNQVLERGPDARMRRTADRPLPAGRVTPAAALVVGTAFLFAGLAELSVGVNGLTAACAALGIAIYLGFYTPLKRRTSFSTVVGAVPGAVPVLMGWAAARGSLDVDAWTLFAILFLWQLPHFLAIAWMYRADYERAGFRMLPIEGPDGASTARQVALYGVALLPVSLLPSVVGLSGPLYFFGALALGLAYVVFGLLLGAQRTGVAARRLLRASVAYLPLLLGLMAVDRVAF